jgi:hypothetical protein
MDKIYYRNGYKYQLAKDYRIKTTILPVKQLVTDYIMLWRDGLMVIRKGYAWDGASGPTYDTKDSMRASLVHDALYQLMRLGLISETYRPYADALFFHILKEDGMNEIRAGLWFEAVTLFAAPAAKAGTEREIKEAP